MHSSQAMKMNLPDAIQSLSSRACASSRGTAARLACETVASPGQRPFCMLCVHCPKCLDKPNEVSCELCAACRVCSVGSFRE